MKKDKSVL